MVAYATVEQIMAATDYKSTAYQTDTLRRLVGSSSRRIEERLHRHFYPLTELRTYTRPEITNPRSATTSGFWLNADLQSLSAVTADDVAITVSTVELYPSQHGPPYSWVGQTGVDIDLTGVWGFSQDTEAAGALAEALDATETGVDVTDSSVIGIGDLVKVDSEQMDVTDKTMLDTAQNLQTTVTADKAVVTIDVEDGTTFFTGEIILIDAERMLIVDISANALTVKRAWDGTVLAAHTATTADIFASRTLTVVRGAVGTTAATHLTAAALTRNVAPGPVTELCVAETINTFEQEAAGYGRTIGSGDNLREARGAGLRDVRGEAMRYQRLRMARV